MQDHPRPTTPGENSRASRDARSTAVRVSLGVPDLKALVVEPKRSPVVRAHSHGHPLVLRNDRSAGVAGLSDALPMPEFDEGSSWQSAVLGPLSNYFPEERRIHALGKLHIIGFPGAM